MDSGHETGPSTSHFFFNQSQAYLIYHALIKRRYQVSHCVILHFLANLSPSLDSLWFRLRRETTTPENSTPSANVVVCIWQEVGKNELDTFLNRRETPSKLGDAGENSRILLKSIKVNRTVHKEIPPPVTGVTVLTFSNYQINAQFVYFSTICMLHYDPQHVSSSTLLILRRTNCITTASGIVTLCKQPYSMQVESGLQSALHLHTVRLFTEGDDTRGCGDTIGPPDDVQRAARNMLRSVV